MDTIGEEHFPLKGNDKIEDYKSIAIGLYGEKMDLSCGKYIQSNHETNVMIKKGVKLNQDTFDILSTFSHPNAVAIIDFYLEGNNHGRFVISKVDTLFSAWLKAEGKHAMIDENVQLKDMFRNMIIDLCDLVLSLLRKGIVSVNGIDMENLYLKISNDGTLRLVFLLTEVKKPQFPDHDVKPSWHSIRKLINSCCTECGVELNSLGKNLSDFIGKGTFTLEKLKSYPDTWDCSMKGDYLLSLHAADQSMMRTQINRTDVQWPFSEHVLPDLLNQIIDDSKLKGFRYNENDAYEYTALLKNSYKHFEDLSDVVKSILVNREGLIKQIEQWSPDIWKELFEIIGMP